VRNELPEAAHYEMMENGRAHCMLCPHECRIAVGKTGICRTRLNEGGRLALLNYGEYTSFSLDPIEKKPLYHFYPGSGILSIGGKGCNFTCSFCQNCDISQGDPPTKHIEPDELAREALGRPASNIGLAFTYNEPFMWFEFMRDSAPLIRAGGGRIVMVTNGYVNRKPLAELLPLIDAMNIDLKAFDDEFYKKYCGGRVEPVKETIAAAVAAGVHVEVTLLLIPTLNDAEDKLRGQAEWLASLSEDIPFHISRYYPCYKLAIPPTPVKTLKRAREIAKEYLNYVYLGNVGDADGARTDCPSCGGAVIERRGYYTETAGLDGGKCARCGAKIAVGT
jgi:pyruvate formate lyase activating enzyme